MIVQLVSEVTTLTICEFQAFGKSKYEKSTGMPLILLRLVDNKYISMLTFLLNIVITYQVKFSTH